MRIKVDPPGGDARRERVERKLFAQLAAVRIADRADSVLPPARKSRLPYVLGFAAAAVAAIALAVIIPGDDAPKTVASPTRVVTPVGGESRFTVGDAVIDAKSDTSVEVQHGGGGAITLVLARGTVDCDVDPRPGRAPFRVVAGDVIVEVVGTRFTVARSPRQRVDVARGKVRVTAPGGTWLVEAGETWPELRTAAVEPEPEPEPEPEIEIDPVAKPKPARAKKAAPEPAPEPEPEKTEPAGPTPRDVESYRIAERFKHTDPQRAVALYRAIATDSKTMAAVALMGLAETHLKLKAPAAALQVLDEHARRFPKSATAEEAAWLRYEALRALGKRDEARGAAAEYLRQFPNGAYADRLRSK